MVEGTVAYGIIFAAISKLCIVIWMGFDKILRSFPFPFFVIIIISIGYFGFDVKKLVKGAFLSWL